MKQLNLIGLVLFSLVGFISCDKKEKQVTDNEKHCQNKAKLVFRLKREK